jgi:hypothetical protein
MVLRISSTVTKGRNVLGPGRITRSTGRLGVKPFDLHGVTYHDVTVLIPGRSVEQARLRPESVPKGIQPR